MSGQNFIRTDSYELSRGVYGSTSREIVDVTATLSSFDVVELEIDATAGTLADVFTIPAGSVVERVTYMAGADHVGGTSIEVGSSGDPDGLLSITTPSTNAITVSTAALVDTALAADTPISITVTGTYSGGTGTLKVRLFDAKARGGNSDNILATIEEKSSQAITLGY
jgi:hypothetical protein